jgi:hypothetical protein
VLVLTDGTPAVVAIAHELASEGMQPWRNRRMRYDLP